jgi:drug/metabolite transporter (DMT)-like permease
MNKSVLLVVIATLFFTVAQLLYKVAAESIVYTITGVLFNYWLWIAIFLYSIGTFFFIYGIKEGELSSLYPLISTSFIWVAIISYFAFKESFGINKFLGIGLIIFGAIVLNYNFKGNKSKRAKWV